MKVVGNPPTYNQEILDVMEEIPFLELLNMTWEDLYDHCIEKLGQEKVEQLARDHRSKYQ